MKFIYWIIIAVILQPIVYLKCFDAQFVFDDRFLIINNNDLNSISNILFGDLWSSDASSSGFYRPLFLLSLAFDKSMFGVSPFGYHLHNIIWHCINVYLFGILVQKLCTKEIAFTALCIFSFHSVLSEGVYWISARNDTMCATFTLLSLLYFLDANPKIIRGSFFFALALLCKEAVIGLPICLLFLCKKEKKRAFKFTVSIVFILISWRILIGISTNLSTVDRWLEVFSVLHIIIVDYTSSILWPWPLSPSTPIAWVELQWWHWILSFIFFALIAISYSRNRKTNSGWIIFAFITFIPVIIPIVYTGIYGDRYLYIPMIAISILLGSTNLHLLFRLSIPIWMFLNFTRGSAWFDDHTFWSDEYTNNPTPFSSVSLAHIKYNKHLYEQAYWLYKNAYSAPTPYLEGCDIYLATVLKKFGTPSKEISPETARIRAAQEVIKEANWVTNRGCIANGAFMGVQAVGYAALGRWEDVELIVSQRKSDPYKRLDVVELSLLLYKGNQEKYCQLWNTWSDKTSLKRQIKVLLPTHEPINCNVEE
jgi:hypothetical protein